MKKEITFYELLTMVKDGNAPKKVCFDNLEWVLRGNEGRQDYYHEGKFLSSCYGEIMYMWEFVGNECIIYEETILTKKENAYLSAVLKPFKDMDMTISKHEHGDYDDVYYIGVDFHHDALTFPNFDSKQNIYMGMEVNRKYTPSELELWEEE